MSETNSRVTRVYLVTLMPDPHNTYEPFFVTLSYPADEAARLDARSSRATSQAFRAAIEIERATHQTPPNRHLLCHSSRFVTEWASAAPLQQHEPRPHHSTRETNRTHSSSTEGRVGADGLPAFRGAPRTPAGEPARLVRTGSTP